MVHTCDLSPRGLQWENFKFKISLGYTVTLSQNKHLPIKTTMIKCPHFCALPPYLSGDLQSRPERAGVRRAAMLPRPRLEEVCWLETSHVLGPDLLSGLRSVGKISYVELSALR